MARRGFSLLELVVVLAIGGLLAGIAVPRMGNASARYRADHAARCVALDFERARNNARLTGATQTITFEPSNHRYTVSGSPTGGASGFTVHLRASLDATITAVSFADHAASFSGYGECKAGGTVTIKVGSATRTITLDEATGQARWQ